MNWLIYLIQNTEIVLMFLWNNEKMDIWNIPSEILCELMGVIYVSNGWL